MTENHTEWKMRLSVTVFVAAAMIAGCSDGGSFHSCYVTSSKDETSFEFTHEFTLQSGKTTEGDLITIQVIDARNSKIDTSAVSGKLDKNGMFSVKYHYDKEDTGKKIVIGIFNETRSYQDKYDLELR